MKPSGRARRDYGAQRLTDAQHLELLPRLLRLAEAHRLHLKLDCSFAPMICAHAPAIELLRAFSIVGCDGGNSLGAILPDGALTGCSFKASEEREGPHIDQHWKTSPLLNHFRAFAADAPEPCSSCDYLRLCKGGCHVVSEHSGGGFEQPDPECPRVLAYRAG